MLKIPLCIYIFLKETEITGFLFSMIEEYIPTATEHNNDYKNFFLKEEKYH